MDPSHPRRSGRFRGEIRDLLSVCSQFGRMMDKCVCVNKWSTTQTAQQWVKEEGGKAPVN